MIADCALSEHLSTVCAFIDTHTEKKDPVLVYSELGYSRAAAVCIAYLMYKKRANVQVSAYISCRQSCVALLGICDRPTFELSSLFVEIPSDS